MASGILDFFSILVKVLILLWRKRRKGEGQGIEKKKLTTHTVWMRSPVCTSVISIHLSAHDHYNCFFFLFVHSPCCICIVCWLVWSVFFFIIKQRMITRLRSCVRARERMCMFAHSFRKRWRRHMGDDWMKKIGLHICSFEKHELKAKQSKEKRTTWIQYVKTL